MGLSSIAYAAEEPVLLTFSDAELRAFDRESAAPKWELTLPRPLAGITFGTANALPHTSVSPWRSAATSSLAYAVDVTSVVHVVDAATGKLVVSIDPPAVGAPTALAAAPDVFALAIGDRVFVSKGDERFELSAEAQALAFSPDGAELAIGTMSSVAVVDVSTRAEILRQPLRAPATTIAWRQPGEWLVGTRRGLVSIDVKTTLELTNAPMVTVAVHGSRLALATSKRVALYDSHVPWTGDAPRAHVELRGQRVRALAYGRPGFVAIGLENGDAAIVDEARFRAVRTMRVGAPRWPVSVTPFVPEPRGQSRPLLGVAVAIIALIVFCIWGVLREQRESHSAIGALPSILRDDNCSSECEASRLKELARTCNELPGAGCGDDAEAALASFDQLQCAEARASLDRIFARNSRRDGASLVRAYVALARNGLATGCSDAPPDPLHVTTSAEDL